MEMASLARVLLLLLAGEASALRHFASGVTSANAVQHLAVSRAASVQMVDNPWNEPILDESLPDPVFDDDYQYKGYSRFGFVEYAEEILLGRQSINASQYLMTRLLPEFTLSRWTGDQRPRGHDGLHYPLHPGAPHRQGRARAVWPAI